MTRIEELVENIHAAFRVAMRDGCDMVPPFQNAIDAEVGGLGLGVGQDDLNKLIGIANKTITAAVDDLVGETMDKIAELIQIYAGLSDRVIEVRGSRPKFTVEPGKAIKIAVEALNSTSNVLALAQMDEAGVTIMGLQMLIPEPAAGEPGDDPQMNIKDDESPEEGEGDGTETESEQAEEPAKEPATV